MDVRRILTVIDGSDQDEALLRQALAVAQSHDARLDALFVRRNAASGGDFFGDAFSTYGMETVLEALDDAAEMIEQRRLPEGVLPDESDETQGAMPEGAAPEERGGPEPMELPDE